MPSSFKQRLAGGELLRVFSVSRVFHPVVIDLFGMVGGYDGFWIDQEHGGATSQEIILAAVCARANAMDCVVRMAPVGYQQVAQALEAGAGGVMAAQIQSLDHAREFLTWAKFAPTGNRGLNSGGYDARYTLKPLPELVVDANRDSLVAIQIETTGALADVDPIAALDGVDMVFFGPADMSMVLGVVGQFDHPALWEAIGQVSSACKKHGKSWGTVAPTPAYAQRAIEAGCQFVTMGGDMLCLRRGIQAVKEGFAASFGA
jgi:2-dehydro-3-deoxyglucarate aldolase/4-hydroxy-2-oxoheptanedioate aldolase